jgi:hypothetical protein
MDHAMNSKHYMAIAIVGGLAVGFFVTSLHAYDNSNPPANWASKIMANLWLSGSSAAGASTTYF